MNSRDSEEHSMYRALAILSAFAVLIPIHAVSAQQNDSENVLEEIVVTATRIPTPFSDTLPSTAIITAEDIERLKPQDLGDLLTRKSGISFRDSGGMGSAGGFFVRGAEDSQVLILIDGIRTASATNGATAIERIPLDSIERIEIIKGPMSGIYGSDAIGGVIQIFTKQADQDEAYGSVETTVGSSQFRKVHTYGGVGTDAYSLHASLTEERTDGIDRTAFQGGGNEDRDGLERTSGNFSFSMEPTEDLSIRIGHVSSSGRVDYDNTSTSSNATRGRAFRGVGWHQRLKLNTSSVRVDYEHSDILDIVGILGATSDRRRNHEPDRNRVTRFYSDTTEASLQANLSFSSKNQVSIGVDGQKDEIESTDTYSATDRKNKGFFALWQYQGDRYGSVINARHDNNDTYGSISNYSAQQSIELTDEYELVVSYGTAFKAPTLNSLFYTDGFFFFGNPDLSPEESQSYEVSLRADFDDLYWQINTYRTEVENLIEWQFDAAASRFNAVNIARANLKGTEIELSREWGDYTLNANLDYLDAEDGSTGQFLDDRARASGSIELGRQLDNLYIGVEGFFEHSRHDRGTPLPGYTLWGVHASYNISDTLSLSGHLDNIFDKEYITNLASNDNPYQNEGRTLEVTLAYKF